MSGVMSLGCRLGAGKPVLMHDPISLGPGGRLPSIEDQNLLHSHNLAAPWRCDLPVLPRGLPVPGPGRAVRPAPVPVLCLPQIEAVSLLLAPT